MHNNVKVKKGIYISYKHTAESFFSEHEKSDFIENKLSFIA